MEISNQAAEVQLVAQMASNIYAGYLAAALVPRSLHEDLRSIAVVSAIAILEETKRQLAPNDGATK